MRARSRPREVDVIEFDPRKVLPAKVRVRSVDEGYEVYNALHNSWIKVREGDMLRVDKAPEDVYPIDRETFNETYDIIK